MVWPEYVAGKGFNETASALIGELYRFSTGAGHLFIHTDGCCSEFLNWGFVNLFDKLVQWRWFHRITWCVFIKGHSYNLCDAAARAMDRALQNVDYYYGLTDMSTLTIQHVVRNKQRFVRKTENPETVRFLERVQVAGRRIQVVSQPHRPSTATCVDPRR